MHARAGDAAASFADATKAVEANPSDLAIRVDYATAAARAGAFERAATALAYVSERKPEDADVATKLADVRTKLRGSHAVGTAPATTSRAAGAPNATTSRPAPRDEVTFYPPSGAAPLGSAAPRIR
jgi:predicted Zn-dependent protease